jgi:hypothetical protein
MRNIRGENFIQIKNYDKERNENYKEKERK